MANLNGHGAGNGGHSQGEPIDTAPVLDPTERAGAGDGCFAYRASPRPYPQTWARRGELEDGQLMAQREVLEHKSVLGPDPAEEAGEDEGEHGGHHPSGPLELQC